MQPHPLLRSLPLMAQIQPNLVGTQVMGKMPLSVTHIMKICYNSGTVNLVVTKMVSKCVQDVEEKSHNVSA